MRFGSIIGSRSVIGMLKISWHCQTKSTKFLKSGKLGISGRKLTPLSERGGAVLFEDISAIEVAVLIEVIVYRCVNGSKLLQGLDVPESGHRSFASPEGLV